jgi:hypothetical protein
MLRRRITIIATVLIVMIMLSASETYSAENDVSPELARKAIEYLQAKNFPGDAERGYGIRVSEPSVYFNYTGKRKYYVFYVYFGPRDIPSWRDIENDLVAYQSENIMRSYIIPADNRETFRLHGWGGYPVTLVPYDQAKEYLSKQFPSQKWEYVRTVIACDRIYFIFTDGSKEMITDRGGVVTKPGELPYLELRSGRLEIWKEIETYLDAGGIHGKSLQDNDSGWSPYGWEATMPTYSQWLGNPPKGRWGCSVAALAGEAVRQTELKYNHTVYISYTFSLTWTRVYLKMMAGWAAGRFARKARV